MSSTTTTIPQGVLPALPAKHAEFLDYLAKNPQKPVSELIEPYKVYEAKLRELYAQEKADWLKDSTLNVVPLYAGQEHTILTRARDLASETEAEKEKYVMPLDSDSRRKNGAPALVQSFKEFQNNFNVFSESSLVEMDWSNVIVAGSAVVTSLTPVPAPHGESKRALRHFYHDMFAPASDVDLFIYGLSEEEAVEKIKKIETHIKDAILTETTTIRTKLVLPSKQEEQQLTSVGMPLQLLHSTLRVMFRLYCVFINRYLKFLLDLMSTVAASRTTGSRCMDLREPSRPRFLKSMPLI